MCFVSASRRYHGNAQFSCAWKGGRCVKCSVGVCHSSELGRKGESCEGRRTEIRAHSRAYFKRPFSLWVGRALSNEVQSKERDVLEKAVACCLVMKLPTFPEARQFIAVFTKSRHLTLS
jgi:hypothetical protein